MKRKSAPKLSPLRRRLFRHDPMCSYYRYSDGNARLTNCSCGRDSALETLAKLEVIVRDIPAALELLK